MNKLSLAILLITNTIFGIDVPWINLTAFNQKVNADWAGAITDIMQHEAPDDSNHYDDLITLGHETSHGIHAFLRNHYGNGQKVNGFYALNNHAVIIPEPHFRKSDISQFIPQSLRGDRYQLYVVGQTEWDDTPLYIFDEWNAYVNGGEVGVSQVNAGKWNNEWQDGVSGQLEFNVYAIAVAMAAQQYDLSYLSNLSFKSFLMFNLDRSMTVFRMGSEMPAFKWDKQDNYLKALQSNPDAEQLRQFAKTYFGSDWCKKEFGF